MAAVFFFLRLGPSAADGPRSIANPRPRKEVVCQAGGERTGREGSVGVFVSSFFPFFFLDKLLRSGRRWGFCSVVDEREVWAHFGVWFFFVDEREEGVVGTGVCAFVLGKDRCVWDVASSALCENGIYFSRGWRWGFFFGLDYLWGICQGLRRIVQYRRMKSFSGSLLPPLFWELYPLSAVTVSY